MASSRTSDLNLPKKFFLLVKELGVSDLFSFGLYQVQLRSGWLRKCSPIGGIQAKRELTLETSSCASGWQDNWRRTSWTDTDTLLSDEAELVLKGQYRPFFSSPELLSFKRQENLVHWTKYSNTFNDKDIKFTWEPARFTWALALARAYQITGDEAHPELFWQKYEEFVAANPVNLGPNWASAQEVALRVTMWILVIPVFMASPSSTPARLTALINSIRQHLERILPTLQYARAQHNNHILSEALGLMAGADFLRHCDSRAEGWFSRGKREFERAILRQVDDDGNYSQHSASYQRMMLQLALLYHALLTRTGAEIPAVVRNKLSLATLWLTSQLDNSSGRLPNLGHNDGTLLLPFGAAEFRDYRPTAQAASAAFLGAPCLPAGPWDELTAWLGLTIRQKASSTQPSHSNAIHKVGTPETWAGMRGVRFQNRPAHADQLHVEVWNNGKNLALDAGTYLYNARQPWQNALDTTRVHNTITIDGLDQMQRISRFLWLDQAQAEWLTTDSPDKIIASHNGYRRIGITHQRALEYRTPGGFLVTDTLNSAKNDSQLHTYRLHWLLPDWQWNLQGQSMTLANEQTQVKLDIEAATSTGKTLYPVEISLVRGGIPLFGKISDEISGWQSDTYGEKHPAISLALDFKAIGSLTITTEWAIKNL